MRWIRVVNGRPRNPSTQGLVEQANGTVKVRLRSWKQDYNTEGWVIALPAIALAMNQSAHGPTKTWVNKDDAF